MHDLLRQARSSQQVDGAMEPGNLDAESSKHPVQSVDGAWMPSPYPMPRWKMLTRAATQSILVTAPWSSAGDWNRAAMPRAPA